MHFYSLKSPCASFTSFTFSWNDVLKHLLLDTIPLWCHRGHSQNTSLQEYRPPTAHALLNSLFVSISTSRSWEALTWRLIIIYTVNGMINDLGVRTKDLKIATIWDLSTNLEQLVGFIKKLGSIRDENAKQPLASASTSDFCSLLPFVFPPLFFWHFSKDGPKEPTRKPDERLWKQKSCSLTRGTRATPARKIQFVPALHRQVSGRQEVREGVGKVLRRVSKRNKTLRTDGNDFPSIRIFIHILKKKKKTVSVRLFFKNTCNVKWMHAS